MGRLRSSTAQGPLVHADADAAHRTPALVAGPAGARRVATVDAADLPARLAALPGATRERLLLDVYDGTSPPLRMLPAQPGRHLLCRAVPSSG